MGTLEFTTNSERETRAAAAETAKLLKIGDVILYEGEMGAGKTAFTKGIAEFFGTEDEVTSPTFALVHEYSGRVPVFHFDLYRISGYDDLYAVGFFDYLDRGGIIAAEWSENVDGLEDELENVVKIRIEKLSENGRKITVSGERFGGG
ncbi:MAG: tRNA (adenosine(37)-N6)-threonylcarbamoyltransferase complex ATPase subunit type 1 TsaE [Ruminococcaceae bacterium]|nr:tRNA (adenosine(37)-N6)-threonylcarbamoyltransferase complex ATPase subunit type 1 TsaE [Oscillospiraceae bacterium]